MSAPKNPGEMEDATREELYELAQERGVEGRSSMTKAELRKALQRPAEDGSGGRRAASRVERFAELAQAAANGDFVMLPRLLAGHDRRLHVRQTLREDHQTRIARHAEGAAAKFDKLADSLFSFFRGTALLFYRDMAGEDAWMPTVLTLGDVHPGNFGVMPNADNTPIFGVNDFDEAYYAPFTWDLKRGAVGFLLAAQESGGYGRKKQRKITKRFVEGYIAGIRRFADDNTEKEHELRADNAPKLIRKLFQDTAQKRSDWLAAEYLDEFRRGFRATEEIVPVSSRKEEFQELIERLVAENSIAVPERAGAMHVKDVAVRKGAGTASLGLSRYYVLIEGPRADGRDDLILELKQARKSALAGLAPPNRHGFEEPGARIKHAQAAQIVRGDVFYGSISFEGLSFISRERAPFRGDIDLDELSKSHWKAYADVCGQSLAHAHALSDEIGALEHDIEPKILEAMGPPELFLDDVLRFAEESAERVRRDHKAFQADHELGAFRSIDFVYE